MGCGTSAPLDPQQPTLKGTPAPTHEKGSASPSSEATKVNRGRAPLGWEGPQRAGKLGLPVAPTSSVLRQRSRPSSSTTSVSASEDGRTVAAVQHDGQPVILVNGRSHLTVLVAPPLHDKPLAGHTDRVNCCSVTPDGSSAVSGSNDKTLRLWDLSTGKCTRVMKGHTDLVLCCSVTPDGSSAVSGSADNTLRLWDLSTGKCTRVMEGHTNWVRCCSVTPDGSSAVSGSEDYTLRIWDLSTGKCTRVMKGHTNSVNCCSVTPDGSSAVSGSWAVSGSEDYTLRVWDLRTGECTRVMEGHTSWVYCCSVTPDGSSAVSGSTDKTLRLWDLRTGKCTRVMEGHTGWVYCCSVTPDGSSAVWGSKDSTLRLWDLSTGKCTRVMEGHTNSVNCCSVTPDGSSAVSGSGDKTLRIWPICTTRALCCASSSLGASAAFIYTEVTKGTTGTGRSFLAQLQPQDRSSYASNGKMSPRCQVELQCGAKAWVGCCFADQPGKTLVAGASDGTLLILRGVLSASSSSVPQTWKAAGLVSTAMRCVSAIQPSHGKDSVIIVAGYANGSMTIWSTSSSSRPEPKEPAVLHTLNGHGGPVTTCSFSPDAKLLVSSGSEDNTVRTWDLGTGEPLNTALTLDPDLGPLLSAALLAPEVLITCQSKSSSLLVWHLGLGMPVARIATPNKTLPPHQAQGSAKTPAKSRNFPRPRGYYRFFPNDDGTPGKVLTSNAAEFALATAMVPTGALLTVRCSNGDVEMWRLSTDFIRAVSGLSFSTAGDAGPGHTGSADSALSMLAEAAAEAKEGSGLDLKILLLAAAAGGHNGVVSNLLKRPGTDLSPTDRHGNSALQLALQRGAWNTSALLIEHYADAMPKMLKQANRAKETLMHTAVAARAPPKVTAALVKAGCELENKEDKVRCITTNVLSALKYLLCCLCSIGRSEMV